MSGSRPNWFDTEADDPRFVVVALTPRSDAAGGDVAFVAFDTRLREAATREGLEVL